MCHVYTRHQLQPNLTLRQVLLLFLSTWEEEALPYSPPPSSSTRWASGHILLCLRMSSGEYCMYNCLAQHLAHRVLLMT
jgi:hypothetical protein